MIVVLTGLLSPMIVVHGEIWVPVKPVTGSKGTKTNRKEHFC